MTAIEEEELRKELYEAFDVDCISRDISTERMCGDDGFYCSYHTDRLDMAVQAVKDREATLSQQYERVRREEFELAQQVFQISLAAVKEFYEQEKKRLQQQSNGGAHE